MRLKAKAPFRLPDFRPKNKIFRTPALFQAMKPVSPPVRKNLSELIR